MADTSTLTPKLPQYATYITGADNDPESVGVQTWLVNTAAAAAGGDTPRGWCQLDLTGLSEGDLAKYFDRTKLGAEYKKQYGIGGYAGKPFAHLQMESDLIYGMHKGFAARYRGRLATYRDDCAQKRYHVFSAISLGIAKFTSAKLAAEKTAARTLTV